MLTHRAWGTRKTYSGATCRDDIMRCVCSSERAKPSLGHPAVNPDHAEGGMSVARCPKCGAALKYKDIMRVGAVFPCPACRTELAVSKLYVILTSYGSLLAPPLLLWVSGFSWFKIVVGGLVAAWPTFWLVARYGKYILRPKLVIYEPPCLSFRENLARVREHRPRPSTNNHSSQLQLRDHSRPRDVR